MRKFKLFLSLLMLMAFSLGNVWGVDYQLVTSTDDLVVGANYVIGTSDGSFIATTTNNNNRKMTSGTITNNVVTATDAMMVFTLGGTSSGWTLYAGNYAGGAGYLNATSTTGSNNVKIVEELDEYAYFTIAITDAGVATITCTGKTSRNILYKNGTTCFSCYNNQTQAQYVKPGLYKEVSSSCSNTVTITKGAEINGSYTLSATEVCGDGEGEDVTISDITPDPGYAFDKITTSASGTVDNENKKVTGITAATTITVLFKELQKYTVSFNTGAGNPAQDAITETTAGAGITLPAGPTPACSADGWTFAGWTATAVASETTTAPTLLSGKYNPTDNVTLYAVYKRTEEGGVADNSVTETFENQTAGSSYNSTQNYEAANSNANIAWTMYYGTVSTNDKITGSNSAQMRWYSSANTTYGYIQNTTAISGLQKISFNARVSNTAVKMSVWYSTDGENWTLIDENLTFDAQNTATPFSSTINGAVGTDYYIRIGVGDGGTAPSSGNYKLIVDDVKFEYKAGASTTYYLSAPSCAPTVNIDPATVAYGDQKQHYAVDAKTFKLTATNLTSGLTLTASTGYTVAPTSLTEEQAMVEGGVTVTVTPVTPTAAGDNNGTVTISGGGLEENVIVNLTMNVTPTFEVKVAVNDEKMGTATINGEASVYADENDLLNLVASPNTGYEFVNWTYDNEKAVLDDPNAASTTVIISEGVIITANFQAQACTNLAAPTLGTLSKNYEYANITWTAVEHADHYVFNLREHEGDARTPLNTNNLGTEMLNLKANTQYDYTVMAVGDGSTYCDENNALLEGSFTTDDYPAATLTLSENGVERALTGSHKLNDVVALPTEVETGVVGKVFVGWDANADCATVPTYAKGANYTIAATADKLYAVYATEVPGVPVITTDELTLATTGVSGTSYTAWSDKTDKSGAVYAGNSAGGNESIQLRAKDNSGIVTTTTGTGKVSKVTLTWNNNTADGRSVKVYGKNTAYTGSADLYGDAKGTEIGSIAKGSTTLDITDEYDYIGLLAVGGALYLDKVEIDWSVPGTPSYSAYVTNGAKKLANPTFSVEEGTYTETKSIELNAADGTIYYTLDGTEPTTESTPYTAAIALDAYGSYTIKAIAAKEDGSKSDVVTATYGINIPFETVSDLFTYIESGKAFLGNISVTGVVSEIVTEYSTEHSNITFNISDTGAESEAQFQSYRGVGEGIAEKVAVGDKVTITGEYTLYGTTHELKQGNVISNRVAAEVSSVVISGEATKTEYFYNDDFSFKGLTAKAVYNTGYEKDVTSEEGLVWSATPATVTATGNVNVTATYGGKTSVAKVVAVTKQLRTITDEQLAWSADAATAYTVGKAYTLPTLTNKLGLAVTYTSETPETATISNEEGHEGEISIVAAGSTVITASFAGNDEYAAKEVSYTLTVVAPASVVITGEASNTAYEYGYNFSFEGLAAKAVYTNEDEYEIPAAEIAWAATPATVTMDNNVSVKATWEGIESAAELVAVTVKKHKVTIVQPDHGTLVVKYSKDDTQVTSGAELVLGTQLIFEIIPESSDYKAGKVLVNNVPIEEMEGTIGRSDYEFSAQIFEKKEAGIEWSTTYGEIQVQGTEIVNSDLPSLTNPYELTITYSSEDTDVAEIDPATGVITPKADGYTTISANFAGTEDYKAAQVSFNLTVEEVAQPEFYLIGSFNGWKEFVPVYDTWYEFENLTPGKHQLKVTTAPNWSEAYGYDELTIKHAGLSKDNDNGNICFTISNESSIVIVDFEKDEDGVKTFTVTGGYDKPTFTVVGVEALVGFNWGDGLNAYENEMAEDPSTGNYELEKEDVMLAAGDYEYQVAMNHDWRGVSNSKLTITESGRYNVTFTFDPSTGATSAVAELKESLVILPTMKIAGDWDVDSENTSKWNENVLIVAGDKKTASYTATNLVSGTWYHFWIIKNGVYMSGNKGFDRENLSADLTTYYTGEGSFAMYFQADKDGDYTFTWTYDTNVITMTFPYKEATALDNTEAGETAVKVMQNGQLMIMKNGKTYNAQGQIIK